MCSGSEAGSYLRLIDFVYPLQVVIMLAMAYLSFIAADLSCLIPTFLSCKGS